MSRRKGGFNIFGYGGGEEPAARADVAERNAAGTSRDLTQLEARVEKLSLVCMAMWSLLQDKTGVTEEELLERVKTLDLMDGVADGKATRTVSRCCQCGRTMSPRHRRCLYCGHSKLVQSAFDAL